MYGDKQKSGYVHFFRSSIPLGFNCVQCTSSPINSKNIRPQNATIAGKHTSKLRCYIRMALETSVFFLLSCKI